MAKKSGGGGGTVYIYIYMCGGMDNQEHNIQQ